MNAYKLPCSQHDCQSYWGLSGLDRFLPVTLSIQSLMIDSSYTLMLNAASDPLHDLCFIPLFANQDTSCCLLFLCV